MYKVIRAFKDVDGHYYNIGDEYNNADTERLEVLSTDKNRYKKPFIEKTEAKKTRKRKTVNEQDE